MNTWRAHALRDRSKPGSMMDPPVGRDVRLAPAARARVVDAVPTPGDALAMLAAADSRRPAGFGGQFGRFTGIDYSDRPSIREIQTAASAALRAVPRT